MSITELKVNGILTHESITYLIEHCKKHNIDLINLDITNGIVINSRYEPLTKSRKMFDGKLEQLKEVLCDEDVKPTTQPITQPMQLPKTTILKPPEVTAQDITQEATHNTRIRSLEQLLGPKPPVEVTQSHPKFEVATQLKPKLITSNSIICDVKPTKHIPQTKSSQQLGVIGENEILKLFQTLRPKNETTKVSATGHLADIHMIDYEHNIKYIIEVKNKQVITKQDIDKFEKDLLEEQSRCTMSTFGIFLSIQSDHIVTKGMMEFNNNSIYLTKPYCNQTCLGLLIELIENYLQIKSNVTTTTINYNIPSNVFTLISQLREQYNNLNEEEELLKSLRDNEETNLKNTNTLLSKLHLKAEFVKFINNEFKDILPTVEIQMPSGHDRMTEYIKSHKKVKKSDLLKLFPECSTEIGSMKLKELISKYSG